MNEKVMEKNTKNSSANFEDLLTLSKTIGLIGGNSEVKNLFAVLKNSFLKMIHHTVLHLDNQSKRSFSKTINIRELELISPLTVSSKVNSEDLIIKVYNDSKKETILYYMKDPKNLDELFLEAKKFNDSIPFIQSKLHEERISSIARNDASYYQKILNELLYESTTLDYHMERINKKLNEKGLDTQLKKENFIVDLFEFNQKDLSCQANIVLKGIFEENIESQIYVNNNGQIKNMKFALFFKENKKELLDGYNSALNRIFKIINNI